MKEAYVPMEIDVQVVPADDVITASEVATVEHDNLFFSWSMFD